MFNANEILVGRRLFFEFFEINTQQQSIKVVCAFANCAQKRKLSMKQKYHQRKNELLFTLSVAFIVRT